MNLNSMTTSKRTHQILSRHGGVLYECELPDAVPAEMAARYTLEKAVNARVFLIGANLAEANLAGAELTGASLMAANLRRANLSEADLCGANLVGVELFGVNLSGANLTGTRLAGASLKGFETVGGRPLLTLNPVGASEQALYAWLTKAGVYIQIGGAFCTREEFCAVIADMHGQGRAGPFRSNLSHWR
jgi:hypothetical protein